MQRAAAQEAVSMGLCKVTWQRDPALADRRPLLRSRLHARRRGASALRPAAYEQAALRLIGVCLPHRPSSEASARVRYGGTQSS